MSSASSGTTVLIDMPKPNLRVLKWLGSVPAAGTCTACKREFKVPLTELKSVVNAQESLRRQFAEHRCPNDAAALTLQNERKQN